MSGFSITELCYGFDMDNLPIISVEKPCDNIISFIANTANIKEADRYYSDEVYIYLGVYIEQFDYSCNFFETYNLYVSKLENNKEKYDNQIKKDIIDLIDILIDCDSEEIHEYDFSKEDLEKTILYFEKLLVEFEPEQLSFTGHSG